MLGAGYVGGAAIGALGFTGRTALAASAVTDIGASYLWNTQVNGSYSTTDLLFDAVFFGMGEYIGYRGVRNGRNSTAQSPSATSSANIIRTERPRGVDPGRSLRMRRAWYADDGDTPIQRGFHDLEGSDWEAPHIPGLQEREGFVGRYGILTDNNPPGSNLHGHHIPSNAYMKNLAGSQSDINYSRRRGIAINVEISRHRRTISHPMGGNNQGLNLSPRDVLERDINDLRNIYRADGLYNQAIEDSLDRLREANIRAWPGIFD